MNLMNDPKHTQMATTQQSTRRPFPIELFKHLEIDDEDYILDGDKVVGVMGDPIPTSIDDELYRDPEEIERLLLKGYKVVGYEDYVIGKQGIPVRSVDNINGYPKDSLTIDVFDCIYFEGICIGTIVYGGLVPLEKQDRDRLAELGIEHKYMYGSQEQVNTLVLGEAIDDTNNLLMSYTLSPSHKSVKPKDKLVVKKIDQVTYIVGQLSPIGIVPLTKEQFDHYTSLGFKIQYFGEMVKLNKLEPVILPWFAKKGLYCEMESNLIVKLTVDGRYLAVGSRRDDAFVPLSDAERKIALEFGFLLE